MPADGPMIAADKSSAQATCNRVYTTASHIWRRPECSPGLLRASFDLSLLRSYHQHFPPHFRPRDSSHARVRLTNPLCASDSEPSRSPTNRGWKWWRLDCSDAPRRRAQLEPEDGASLLLIAYRRHMRGILPSHPTSTPSASFLPGPPASSRRIDPLAPANLQPSGKACRQAACSALAPKHPPASSVPLSTGGEAPSSCVQPW